MVVLSRSNVVKSSSILLFESTELNVMKIHVAIFESSGNLYAWTSTH